MTEKDYEEPRIENADSGSGDDLATQAADNLQADSEIVRAIRDQKPITPPEIQEQFDKQREQTLENAAGQISELIKDGKISDPKMLGEIIKDTMSKLPRNDKEHFADLQKKLNEKLKDSGHSVSLDPGLQLNAGGSISATLEMKVENKDGKVTDSSVVELSRTNTGKIPSEEHGKVQPDPRDTRIKDLELPDPYKDASEQRKGEQAGAGQNKERGKLGAGKDDPSMPDSEARKELVEKQIKEQQEALNNAAKKAAELLKDGKILDKDMLAKILADAVNGPSPLTQIPLDPTMANSLENKINEQLKGSGQSVKIDVKPVFGKKGIDHDLTLELSKGGKVSDQVTSTIATQYYPPHPEIHPYPMPKPIPQPRKR